MTETIILLIATAAVITCAAWALQRHIKRRAARRIWADLTLQPKPFDLAKFRREGDVMIKDTNSQLLDQRLCECSPEDACRFRSERDMLLEALNAVLADCQDADTSSELTLAVGRTVRAAVAKAEGNKHGKPKRSFLKLAIRAVAYSHSRGGLSGFGTQRMKPKGEKDK